MIPTFTTVRPVLRPSSMAYFDGYAAFLASDRVWVMGGPLSVETAWSYFTNDGGQWALLGMGGLIVERQDEPGAIGQVAVCHGPIFPEPELGWLLYDGHEGQGYASEAAAAMRDWALGPRGLSALVSYIDPANDKYARLAERLVAVFDPWAATSGNAPTLDYRCAMGDRA
ncbi:MAG: GNAT family N-acetyltransferase [Rhodobacterales bacterium]|nr:GNAT family N-acetyltransferase [Rhodobacterales bacterium]